MKAKLICFYIALELILALTNDGFQFPAGYESLIANVDTSFSCDGKPYGYYADTQNECKIFHICHPLYNNQKVVSVEQFSFLCGNGTIFNQANLTCMDVASSTPCNYSPQYAEEANSFFGRSDAQFRVEIFGRGGGARNFEPNNFAQPTQQSQNFHQDQQLPTSHLENQLQPTQSNQEHRPAQSGQETPLFQLTPKPQPTQPIREPQLVQPSQELQPVQQNQQHQLTQSGQMQLQPTQVGQRSQLPKLDEQSQTLHPRHQPQSTN